MAPVWTAILAHFFVKGDRSPPEDRRARARPGGTALLVGAANTQRGAEARACDRPPRAHADQLAVAAICIARSSRRNPHRGRRPADLVGALVISRSASRSSSAQHWTARWSAGFAYLVIGGSCIGWC